MQLPWIAASLKSSINAGASWQNQTFPVGMTNSLSISPVNPGSLFAGTDNGVFISVNDGAWTQLGLAGQNVTGIAAHPTMIRNIIAGTKSGSLLFHKQWPKLEFCFLLISPIGLFEPSDSTRMMQKKSSWEHLRWEPICFICLNLPFVGL